MNLPIKIELPDDFLKEETRCDHVVSQKMKKIWAVELDLLSEFDRVCMENNIKYSVTCGTLIGAVRHNGYVPWDDDIDVMMQRKEYERLCKLSYLFKQPYFFQSEYTDPGSLRGHAQLRNSLTTAILNSEYKYGYEYNQGVFIDIFPYDNIPDNRREKQRFIIQLSICKKIIGKLKISSYDRYSNRYCIRLIKHILYPIIALLNKSLKLDHRLYRLFELIMTRYNNKRTKKVGICFFLPMTEKFTWASRYTDRGIRRHRFEFIDINIPRDYEGILNDIYGNWKTPIKAANMHGELIYDAEKPYHEYLNKNNKYI